MSETAQPQPQELLDPQAFEQTLGERLHDMASYAVYRTTEMADSARRPLAVLAGAAVLIGVAAKGIETTTADAAPRPPGFSEDYPDAGSLEVQNKIKALNRKCGAMDPLSVNGGSVTSRRNKFGSLKIVKIEDGDRQKFVWTHSAKTTVCGLVAFTRDKKAYFPKPDHRGQRGGYFVDPSVSMSNGSAVVESAEQFGVFFRRKRV